MRPALRPGVTSPVPWKRKRVLLLSLSTWKASLRRPSSTNMTPRLTCPESLTSMPCAWADAAPAASAAAMKTRPLFIASPESLYPCLRIYPGNMARRLHGRRFVFQLLLARPGRLARPAARAGAEHLLAQGRDLGLVQPLGVVAQLAHFGGGEGVDLLPRPLRRAGGAGDAHRGLVPLPRVELDLEARHLAAHCLDLLAGGLRLELERLGLGALAGDLGLHLAVAQGGRVPARDQPLLLLPPALALVHEDRRG